MDFQQSYRADRLHTTKRAKEPAVRSRPCAVYQPIDCAIAGSQAESFPDDQTAQSGDRQNAGLCDPAKTPNCALLSPPAFYNLRSPCTALPASETERRQARDGFQLPRYMRP